MIISHSLLSACGDWLTSAYGDWHLSRGIIHEYRWNWRVLIITHPSRKFQLIYLCLLIYSNFKVQGPKDLNIYRLIPLPWFRLRQIDKWPINVGYLDDYPLSLDCLRRLTSITREIKVCWDQRITLDLITSKIKIIVCLLFFPQGLISSTQPRINTYPINQKISYSLSTWLVRVSYQLAINIQIYIFVTLQNVKQKIRVPLCPQITFPRSPNFSVWVIWLIQGLRSWNHRSHRF
jgi:hypothetical protein